MSSMGASYMSIVKNSETLGFKWLYLSTILLSPHTLKIPLLSFNWHERRGQYMRVRGVFVRLPKQTTGT